MEMGRDTWRRCLFIAVISVITAAVSIVTARAAR